MPCEKKHLSHFYLFVSPCIPYCELPFNRLLNHCRVNTKGKCITHPHHILRDSSCNCVRLLSFISVSASCIYWIKRLVDFFIQAHSANTSQMGFHYSQSLDKHRLLKLGFSRLFSTFCSKNVRQQQLTGSVLTFSLSSHLFIHRKSEITNVFLAGLC